MFYKVIIIEDEDIIRNGIKYSIDWHKLNLNVVADTGDALEAKELIIKHEPHIILVDINMPVLSGLDIIEEMRQSYNFTSIIISGYNDFEYAQKAIELGVVRYLTKPIDRNELQDALLEAIDKQKRKVKISNISAISETQNIDKQYNKIEHDNVTKEIINYVEGNYQRKITLNDIVNEIGFSESTINNRLKESVGTTFNQYLNNYRIHNAINIINDDPTVNLQDVALSVGIANYKHFSHVFKKVTNYSPREYVLKIK